jgi:hypothetical protein
MTDDSHRDRVLTRRGSRLGRTLLLVGGVLVLATAGCAPEEEPAPADPPVEEPVPDADADTPRPPPVDPGAAPPPDDPPTQPPPARELEEEDPRQGVRREEGLVGVTGTGVAPVAILRLAEGGSLGITGELAREIRRLSGARIVVEGRETATPVGPGLDVTTYEILEIEGRRPLVGVLRRVEEAWTLLPEDEEAEPIELLGMPERGVEEGAKVWVTGLETEDGRFRVESHGVVIPAA